MAHITRAWLRCVKHTARSVHPGAGELLAMREAQWSSEVESLRRMLATATEKEGGLERQLARRSLATEAGNKEDGVVHAGNAAHPPASSNVLRGVGPTPPDVAARAARHSAEAGVAGVAAPRPPLRWYTLAVRTSGARGAGGTSKVYVSLHGAAGSSARVDLPSHRGDFAAGREATFRMRAPALGPLQRLTLGVAADLAGPAGGWVPELIEVTDESAGEKRMPRGHSPVFFLLAFACLSARWRLTGVVFSTADKGWCAVQVSLCSFPAGGALVGLAAAGSAPWLPSGKTPA